MCPDFQVKCFFRRTDHSDPRNPGTSRVEIFTRPHRNRFNGFLKGKQNKKNLVNKEVRRGGQGNCDDNSLKNRKLDDGVKIVTSFMNDTKQNLFYFKNTSCVLLEMC